MCVVGRCIVFSLWVGKDRPSYCDLKKEHKFERTFLSFVTAQCQRHGTRKLETGERVCMKHMYETGILIIVHAS